MNKRSLLFVVTLALGIFAAGGSTGVCSMRTLTPCQDSPNCVSSETTLSARHLPPVPFSGSPAAAQARLMAAILAQPRATIVVEEPGYLEVQFRSRVWGFVDEAQFLVDGERQVIRFRSGARSGYYDFDVNRSRLEKIFARFSQMPAE